MYMFVRRRVYILSWGWHSEYGGADIRANKYPNNSEKRYARLIHMNVHAMQSFQFDAVNANIIYIWSTLAKWIYP